MIASDRRGLDSQVLLLNRFYMAMKVITARQSFILLCRDAAEVIDVDVDRDDAWLQHAPPEQRSRLIQEKKGVPPRPCREGSLDRCQLRRELRLPS